MLPGSGLTVRFVKKVNVLSEHNADSVVLCDSIYVVNVHMTTYIWKTSLHELRGIIRSSVTAKTPPSIPPPTTDSFCGVLMVYTLSCRRHQSNAHALLWQCRGLQRWKTPLQCSVLLLLLVQYVVRERVRIKVVLNCHKRKRLSV